MITALSQESRNVETATRPPTGDQSLPAPASMHVSPIIFVESSRKQSKNSKEYDYPETHLETYELGGLARIVEEVYQITNCLSEFSRLHRTWDGDLQHVGHMGSVPIFGDDRRLQPEALLVRFDSLDVLGYDIGRALGLDVALHAL